MSLERLGSEKSFPLNKSELSAVPISEARNNQISQLAAEKMEKNDLFEDRGLNLSDHTITHEKHWYDFLVSIWNTICGFFNCGPVEETDVHAASNSELVVPQPQEKPKMSQAQFSQLIRQENSALADEQFEQRIQGEMLQAVQQTTQIRYNKESIFKFIKKMDGYKQQLEVLKPQFAREDGFNAFVGQRILFLDKMIQEAKDQIIAHFERIETELVYKRDQSRREIDSLYQEVDMPKRHDASTGEKILQLKEHIPQTLQAAKKELEDLKYEKSILENQKQDEALQRSKENDEKELQSIQTDLKIAQKKFDEFEEKLLKEEKKIKEANKKLQSEIDELKKQREKLLVNKDEKLESPPRQIKSEKRKAKIAHIEPPYNGSEHKKVYPSSSAPSKPPTAEYYYDENYQPITSPTPEPEINEAYIQGKEDLLREKEELLKIENKKIQEKERERDNPKTGFFARQRLNAELFLLDMDLGYLLEETSHLQREIRLLKEDWQAARQQNSEIEMESLEDIEKPQHLAEIDRKIQEKKDQLYENSKQIQEQKQNLLKQQKQITSLQTKAYFIKEHLKFLNPLINARQQDQKLLNELNIEIGAQKLKIKRYKKFQARLDHIKKTTTKAEFQVDGKTISVEAQSHLVYARVMCQAINAYTPDQVPKDFIKDFVQLHQEALKEKAEELLNEFGLSPDRPSDRVLDQISIMQR